MGQKIVALVGIFTKRHPHLPLSRAPGIQPFKEEKKTKSKQRPHRKAGRLPRRQPLPSSTTLFFGLWCDCAQKFGGAIPHIAFHFLGVFYRPEERGIQRTARTENP